jgi:hypothetical protein
MVRIRAKSIFWLLLFALATLGSSEALQAQLCCEGYHDTRIDCTGPNCTQTVYARTSCIHAQYSGYLSTSGFVSCCGTNWFSYQAGSRCYVEAPEQASSAPPTLFARTFYVRDCSGNYVLTRVGGPATS